MEEGRPQVNGSVQQDDAGAAGKVEELQGIYGPYTFPERLLQKIWLQGLFETRTARLSDGRSLEVLAPGRWNRLGGPDFRGARLRIDGQEVTGDVEVHFHAADWARHGHGSDPAYNEVVLHVVLYEPRGALRPPCTSLGRPIAQLVLLPWLHCCLEEFAADDAVEGITHRDTVRLGEVLLDLEPAARTQQLRVAAEKRWRQKVAFAGARIARLGWAGACYHTALEILGYRFNRAAMLAVAERWPLDAGRGIPTEAEALAAGGALWRTQGVRPANAPRRRLAQYRAWVAAVPDWPERWRQWGETTEINWTEEAPIDVAAVRRFCDVNVWRARVGREIVGGALAGARLDTLIANGLLPLLATQVGDRVFVRWFCGAPSEVPESMREALRLAGVAGRGAAPWHEGAVQGMLQLALERSGEWGQTAGDAAPAAGADRG